MTQLNPPYLGDPNYKAPLPQMAAPIPAPEPSPRLAATIEQLDKLADELDQTADNDTAHIKQELSALIDVVRGVVSSQGP